MVSTSLVSLANAFGYSAEQLLSTGELVLLADLKLQSVGFYPDFTDSLIE